MKHEFTIGWKTSNKKLQKKVVKDSEIAYKYIKEFYDEETIELFETAYVIVLNQANKILGIHKLSEGGLTSTIIDVRKVILATILMNGKAAIIAHNHPSGNLTFSKSDLDITKRLKEALKVCELELLDHILITTEGYKSIADEGLL